MTDEIKLTEGQIDLISLETAKTIVSRYNYACEAAEGNSFASFPEYAAHARRDVVQRITEAWPLEIIPADAEAVRKTAEHIADRVRANLIMILGGRDGTLNLYRNQYTRVRIDLEKVERDLLERRHPKRPEWTP